MPTPWPSPRRRCASPSRARSKTDAVKTVLERLETDRAAAAAGAGLTEQFESALAVAAKALPTQQARLAFASDYLRLRTQAPSGEALRGLIARHFAGADRQRLDALVGLMTPQNLADTFARISKDNRKLDYMLVEGFQTLMYACQEDMDFNSPAGAAAMSARLQKDYLWPAEATQPADALIGGFYASCELFPKHYRPGFHDPVTADIPTLVFSGKMDTQTATSWGPETARHLPRGQAIVFPEAGHGALAFSQCARDLGVAFIENPARAAGQVLRGGADPDLRAARGSGGGQAGGDTR